MLTILLVTWFWPGQPPVIQQTQFADWAACEHARLAIIADQRRLEAEGYARQAALQKQGTIHNPAIPKVSAVCAPQVSGGETRIPKGDLLRGFDPQVPPGSAVSPVPENTTPLPKTRMQITGGSDNSEKVVTLKKGDTISSILRDLGARPDEITAIQAALGNRGRDSTVKDGQKIKVLLSPADDGKRMQPVRVVLASETSVEAVAALSDLGKYVSVDPQFFR